MKHPYLPAEFNPGGDSLAMQNLEYNLFTENARAAIAQTAMGNTSILVSVAQQLADNNPALVPELQDILSAYVYASQESIIEYGHTPITNNSAEKRFKKTLKNIK